MVTAFALSCDMHAVRALLPEQLLPHWFPTPASFCSGYSCHAFTVVQVFTQVTLVLLLWGTMCGGLALISDVAVIMVHKGFGDGHPASTYLNGRTCMTAVAILVLYPLCLQRHMREVSCCRVTCAMSPCCYTCSYPAVQCCLCIILAEICLHRRG